MVLLSATQVQSIAVSSFVVVSFTVALFLSGYAIQQRTLSQLRIAIRPESFQPQIYLPDRFKTTTTELEDGTVVELRQWELDELEAKKSAGVDKDVVVEVKPTVAEQKSMKHEAEKTIGKDAKASAREEGSKVVAEKEEQPLSRAERRRKIKAEIQRLSQGETPVYYQRRLW